MFFQALMKYQNPNDCIFFRMEEQFQIPGAPLLGHLALLSSKPELDHALFIAHFLAALPHSNLPCMQPSGIGSSLGCYCSLYSAHCAIDIKNEWKGFHFMILIVLNVLMFWMVWLVWMFWLFDSLKCLETSEVQTV